MRGRQGGHAHSACPRATAGIIFHRLQADAQHAEPKLQKQQAKQATRSEERRRKTATRDVPRATGQLVFWRTAPPERKLVAPSGGSGGLRMDGPGLTPRPVFLIWSILKGRLSVSLVRGPFICLAAGLTKRCRTRGPRRRRLPAAADLSSPTGKASRNLPLFSVAFVSLSACAEHYPALTKTDYLGNRGRLVPNAMPSSKLRLNLRRYVHTSST